MITTQMQAFLDMIAACEGTNTDEGWRALFGYTPSNHRCFTDFSDHPNIKYPFTRLDGTTDYSTAAGRFQIIHLSWVIGKAKWSLPDFSPDSQTRWAIGTINDLGAAADVEAGHLQMALDKCAGTWASLPASHYSQPKRSYDFAEDAFAAAGGTVFQ